MLMMGVLAVAEGIKWLRSRSNRNAAKVEWPAPLKEQIRRDPVRK
jgi:hypothetical protein